MPSATAQRAAGRRAAGLLLALLAACHPMPRLDPSAAARIVEASPAEAAERAAAALAEAGFATTRLASAAVPTVRGERAGGVDPAWAHCPGIWTNDPFSDLGQSRFVQPEGRRAVVLVRASSLPQGTSVTVDLLTIGLYRHAFTGDLVESPCASTGVLERRILDAVAGAAPPPARGARA